MKPIFVLENELKPKYRYRELMWNIWFKIFFSNYTKLKWSNSPLVQFPLLTDIAIGSIKYMYYEYGYKYVKNYICRYHLTIQSRIVGEKVKEEELDIVKFHIQNRKR